MNRSTTARRHRVVIVGCGFGGLSAAKALRRADVYVTVIDRTNHHLVQPLLHQVATGILSEGDVALPIRDVLRHQRNTRVVLGAVTNIDLDDRARSTRQRERHRAGDLNAVTCPPGLPRHGRS